MNDEQEHPPAPPRTPRAPRPHRPPAGERLRRLLRPSRSQLVAGVLVGLLGFAAVTQVHARQAGDDYRGLREADLVQVLNGLNAQSRRADNEISSLERTRRQLTDSSQRRDAATRRAKEQATTLGILAGTLPTHGPGIRLTVRDPDGRVSLNNLLDAVEELRAAGAEAIEIDDSVRIVAQSAFDQSDQGLRVDGRRIAAPYVIDVIGNPDTLASAVDFAEGFSYDVRQSGGSVKIAKRTNVVIGSVVKSGSADDEDQ